MAALVELAGAVAHELNNIFTAVAGNLSLLDEDLPGDADSSARIGEVIRTAQRGIVLSSKLQAFAGRQPLRRKRSDISRLVGRVVQDLPPARLDGVRLRVALAREECPSFVDEDKLRACVDEILRNALAAMPDGGQIIVETRSHTAGAEPTKNMPALRPGRYVMIAVSDTGKGMAPHVAARAVDPLFTTKTPGINAGWGLSNCAGFVRQSGGYMTLASKLGLGTRVEIYLPLQQG
ncbi:MAG TPA: ATP-binding protein [Rhizomicrobium sp.]